MDILSGSTLMRLYPWQAVHRRMLYVSTLAT